MYRVPKSSSSDRKIKALYFFVDKQNMNRFKLNTILNFIVVLVMIVIVFVLVGLISQNRAKESMSYGKLNDLMNFIDTKYVHVLDFMNREKQNVVFIAESHIAEDYDKGKYEEVNKYLTRMKKNSALEIHSQKAEKDSGKNLKQVFGRVVKWDIYRLNERLYRYDEIFVLNKDGKVVSSSRKQSIGKDLSDDEFFTNGKKQVFVKDFYKDYTGNVVVGFASPIKNGAGKVIGVIAEKVDAKFVNDLITGDLGNQVGGKLFFAGLGQYLDLYMVNKEGYMVTQSKRLKGKKDTVLSQKVDSIPVLRCRDEKSPVREAQEVYNNFLGESVAGASMCVFDMGWTMVAEQTTDDAFKTIYSGINILYYGALFAIAIIFLLTVAFSRFIWSAVRRSSNQVISAVSQLFQSSKQTSETSQQNATIAYQLASGATEQSKQADFVSKTTAEMANSVQQMSSSAQEVSKTAEKTAKMAEAAKALGSKSQASLDQIKQIISNSADEIQATADKSKKIEEIIETINNIASKTHILALNAAIEASRAGEAGGGFAIIADQVRELAANSSNSAKEVKDQIGKIVTQIDAAVSSFRQGVDTADKSSAVINETLNTLQSIAAEISKVSEMMINVSATIQQQSSAVQEVASNMDSIAVVAKQNATGSRQLSSSIEQLVSTNKQVASAAKQLHSLASDLQKIAGGVGALGVKLNEQRQHKPTSNEEVASTENQNEEDL